MQGNESPVVVMFSGLASLVSSFFNLASKLLLLVIYPLLTALEPSCHSRDVVTERERGSFAKAVCRSHDRTVSLI